LIFNALKTKGRIITQNRDWYDLSIFLTAFIDAYRGCHASTETVQDV